MIKWFAFVVFFICITYGSELQLADQIINLAPGTIDHNKVPFQKWVYYKIQLPAHKGATLKVEHSKGATKTHDVDVFVRKGGELPDRSQYDYFDINIMNIITVDILAEPVDTVFIAGVYGFSGLETFFTLSYEITNGCPQDCNNFGLCRRDSTCACYTGHVGTYCQYNSTAITLEKSYTGSIVANHWNYYSVDIFAANNIEVHVTHTGGDVDLYLRNLAIPDFINYSYVDYSSATEFTLQVNNPTLGTWYLGFYAFYDASYTFTVREQRTCPMNCSFHGTCVGTLCQCNAGFTGHYCEDDTVPLTSTDVHGYVDQNSWNFYQFNANSDNSVSVIVRETDEGSNCDLYIMNGAKPTRFLYQYTDVTEASESQVTVNHPGTDTWHIGVFGAAYCEYNIHIVSNQVINPCGTCVHGACQNNLCVCNAGWFGMMCDIQPTPLTNGVRTATIQVKNREWQYFSISTTDTSLLSVVVNEETTSGMVWLYASKENYPTTDSYEVVDNAVIANHRLSIEFTTPKSHHYVIGIYGSPYIVNPTGVNVSLVAWYTPF